MNEMLDRAGSPRFLGTVVICAWALYFTMVALTNVTDAIREVSDSTYTFASGNYVLMLETMSVHGSPEWLTVVLFGCAIAAQIMVALLCWRAFGLRMGDAPNAAAATRGALALSALLWASFVVMTEVFLAYGIQGTHWTLFVASVISYAACYMVDRPREIATAGENGGVDEAERRVLDVRRHVLIHRGDSVPSAKEAALN